MHPTAFKTQAKQIIHDVPIYTELEFKNDTDGKKLSSYLDNYDKISKDHMDLFDKSGKHFIDEETWNELEEGTLALIEKYRQPGKATILDVGVGLGRLLEQLDKEKYERFGVDISLNYLVRAKAKNLEVCMAFAEDLPYRDNFFDIVVCTDVLEHVLDLNLAMKEVLRCLKPGGKLIIRVPYKEDLSAYLTEDCPYDFVHLRNFDEGNLQMLTKIFDLSFEEYSLSGRNNSYHRFKLFNKNTKLSWFSKSVYYLLKVGERFLRCNIKEYFFEYEINFVATKRREQI